MSDKTAIEWTDATWNPLRGCTRVSAGCVNCYAESVAARFSGPGMPYEGLAKMTPSGPRWTGVIKLVEEHLTDPLRWRKPRRVFVNSMSDLFHPDVPDEFIARVFAVMALAPQHTFQVLTKRPERMAALLSRVGYRQTVEHAARVLLGDKQGDRRWDEGFANLIGRADGWPLPKVWLGTSVENQAAADERIPHLLRTPAAVRFLSCEPLLGPVDLFPWLMHMTCKHGNFAPEPDSPCDGCTCWPDRAPIGWVIVGGESGPHARPMHPEWARSLRDQCQTAGVPFFFKQHGEWLPVFPGELAQTQMHGGRGTAQLVVLPSGEVIGASDGRRQGGGYVESNWQERGGAWMRRAGKHAAGRLLDGREWSEFPQAVTA